jgi:hypothetical protein
MALLRSPLARLAPLATAALLAVSAAAGEARANPRSPEVLNALEALRDKRFEDAIKACAPAPGGEIQPSCPLIRAHALHALGRHLEAYEALRLFGDHGGDEAKNAPLTRETFRSALLANLARVTVTCSASGPADVLVNGKVAKTCPTPAPVVTEPGEILVEVRKAGFKTVQTKVQASAGGTVTARIDLVPASANDPATPPNENNAGQTSETPEPGPETPKAATTSDPETPAKTSTDKPKKIDLTSYGPGLPAKAGPEKDPEPRSSSSSSSSRSYGSGCGDTCQRGLLTLGGLLVIGATIVLVAVALHETIPADKGTIPPGQVKVPLAAW